MVGKLNIVQTKITEYKNSNSIYDKIMLGILYIKTGDKKRGIIILDDIVQSNPELLISQAIRHYLKECTE